MVGKQLQVAMNLADEQAFLSFLRCSTDIAIFESFAPTLSDLWVETFAPGLSGHWFYGIWNKNFPWNPEYGTIGDKAHDPRHIGWKYVANRNIAPVLEMSRSKVLASKYGRLYWGKTFSAPNGLSYDEESFRKWIDHIWHWVRKNGKKDKQLKDSPYFLPGAFHEHSMPVT